MARPRSAVARGQAPDRAPVSVGRLLLFLTLLLCPLIFSTSTLEAFEFPKTMLLRGVALVFAGTGLHAVGRALLAGAPARMALAGWRRDPVAWTAVALLAAGAASSAASISPRTSLLGGHESFAGLLTLASYVVLFFALRSSCRETRHYRELLPAVALALAGAAGYAVLQALRLDPISWSRTQEFMGLWRAQGTLGNATFLGGFLATALPLVALLALEAARRRGWRSPLSVWRVSESPWRAGPGWRWPRAPR